MLAPRPGWASSSPSANVAPGGRSSTTTRCGRGRSPTDSRSAGPRSGSYSGSSRRRRTSRCSTSVRCPVPAGSPVRRSTTPSTCCDRARADPARSRWSRGHRAASGPSSRGPSSPSRWHGLVPASSGSAWAAAIASPRTCRTSPRRSSRSSRPAASARRGRRVPPSSVCRRCSTASARSSRRCCSLSRGTATDATT